jgi:hypothetical protein
MLNSAVVVLSLHAVVLLGALEGAQASRIAYSKVKDHRINKSSPHPEAHKATSPLAIPVKEHLHPHIQDHAAARVDAIQSHAHLAPGHKEHKHPEGDYMLAGFQRAQAALPASKADSTHASHSLFQAVAKSRVITFVSDMTHYWTPGQTKSQIKRVPSAGSDVLQTKVSICTVAFLVLVLGCCCGCWLLPREMSKDKDHKPKKMRPSAPSSQAQRFNQAQAAMFTPTCERKQHTHAGRIVYEWDQTPAAANLYITVPQGIKKHDLEIIFEKKRLTVGCKGKPAFMCEETFDEVSETRSAWRLRTNGELQVRLRKVTEVDWPYVCAPAASQAAMSA